MLSTYKKWLKRELVKKGYWTIGVQTLGKREFEAFVRVFVKATYSDYRCTIKTGLRTRNSQKIMNGLVDETGFYTVHKKYLGTKNNYCYKLVEAIRKAKLK